MKKFLKFAAILTAATLLSISAYAAGTPRVEESGLEGNTYTLTVVNSEQGDVAGSLRAEGTNATLTRVSYSSAVTGVDNEGNISIIGIDVAEGETMATLTFDVEGDFTISVIGTADDFEGVSKTFSGTVDNGDIGDITDDDEGDDEGEEGDDEGNINEPVDETPAPPVNPNPGTGVAVAVVPAAIAAFAAAASKKKRG